MPSERFEMRVPTDLMERVDQARGYEPRASFVKRAVEAALGGPEPHRPAAPRAPTRQSPAPALVSDAMARQQKLNDAKYGRRS